MPAARRGSTCRRPKAVRRIFDSGSFFGVGISEATVIALLGWFLLGPEELYRLAKQAGNWLGELRSFVGQAAQQYESALDDDSTRKAIEGIRQTQRTVSEISESWRSVTDSFRNPLALGGSIDAAYTKFSEERKAKKESDEEGAEKQKAKDEKAPTAGAVPDLKAETAPEPVATVDGVASKEVGPATPSAGAKEEEGETAEELERKRAASVQAVSEMWYKEGAAADRPAELSRDKAETYANLLDDRLSQIDELFVTVQELKEGILEDRRRLSQLLETKPEAESPEAPKAATEPSPAAVPAGGVEAHSGRTVS